MTSRAIKYGIIAIASVIVTSASTPADDAVRTGHELELAQTVVLANKNVPESIALARHYLQARGIPENHLCALDLPAGEIISRRFYETRLRDPLLAFLREQKLIEQVKRSDDTIGPNDSGWRTTVSRVRYLVSIYGVPLRIAGSRPFWIEKLSRLVEEPFQQDTAAVDSELACVLWETYELRGIISNPLYNQLVINRAERQTRPVVIAARLDGPDATTVRRMIDDAIATEASGLQGRAYIDTRSIREPDYYMGDYWLREAGVRLSRYGMDVIFDAQESLFAEAFPMQDAAVYLGWYTEHVTGPFRQPAFSFRRGAVAYHLQSGSAKSLRTREQYWAGPLLAAGAAAVMGAVYEPYLSYTPDLQIFADRLLAGYSFGESAYLSQRALSWQITVVGDPLYRPFSRTPEALIKQLTDAKDPDVAWAYIRRINLLADQQQLNIALGVAREALTLTGSPLIREKIADLYAKNDLWADAIREYRRVIDEAESGMTAVRVGSRLAMILSLLNRGEEAQALVERVREAWPESPWLIHLESTTP